MGRKQYWKGESGGGRRLDTNTKSVNPTPLPIRILVPQSLLGLHSGSGKGRKLSPAWMQPRSRRSPTDSSAEKSTRHQSNVSALSNLAKDLFDPSLRLPMSIRRKANRSIECDSPSPLSASGHSRSARPQMQTIYSPSRSPALSLPRSLRRNRLRAGSGPSPLQSLQTYFQAFHLKSRKLLQQLERRVLG